MFWIITISLILAFGIIGALIECEVWKEPKPMDVDAIAKSICNKKEKYWHQYQNKKGGKMVKSKLLYRIEIRKSRNKKFFWIMTSACNGQTISTSEMYSSKQACLKTASSLKKNLKHSELLI